jgi:ATP-dependent helicase/nuclease subunit B
LERSRLYIEPITMAQTRLENLLREYQAEDPLAPVTVVVPTTYAGLFLRRDIGKRGLVNVGFNVLPRLTELLGAPSLAAKKLRPLTPLFESAAVRQAALEASGPFEQFKHHPSFHSRLRSTFRELRYADVNALDNLERSGGSRSQVVQLYRRFREHTSTYYDREALAIAASETVRNGRAAVLRDLGPVIVYLVHDLTAGEQQLIEALRSAWHVSIVFGATGDHEADTTMRATDARLKSVGREPSEATPSGAIESKLLIASDGREEFRWVARRIAADAHNGVPFHRMAVLFWQREPYASLIAEQLGMAEVPITGPAPGTLASSAVGRTVKGLVDMAGGDLPRKALMEWLTGSPVKSPRSDIRPSQWDVLSRNAGIVAGVDQWEDRLERYAARLERSVSDQSEEVSEAKFERMTQAATDARALLNFVIELNTNLIPPDDGQPWPDFVDWTLGLVQKYLNDDALPADEETNLESLRSGLREMEVLADLESSTTLDKFHTAFDDMLSTPSARKGRFGEGVFVGPVGASIGLRFDKVYLVGMIEGLVPPRIGDDPLLPDKERGQSGLPLRRDTATEERYKYLAAMAAGTSRVLTFARGDNTAQKAQHPSRWFLEEASRLNGSQVFATTLATLRDKPWLEVVASQEGGLRGIDAAQPADAHDYDLHGLLRWKRSGRPIGKHHLAASENVLSRALQMEQARTRHSLTIWDGDLSEVSGTSRRIALTDRSVFSPTRLESWATCPYRYFLSSVLGIAALEQPEDVATITPLERGSLVHSILESFIREAQRQTMIPRPDEASNIAHLRLLMAIADRELRDAENRGVTGKRLLWELAQADIRSDLSTFLEEDSRIRREYGVSPHSVELTFGTPRHRRRDATAAPPVELPAHGTSTLSFRGIIDRLDVSASGEKALVIDYKTGSPGPFARLDKDPVDRGKHVQLPVYGLAVRQLLGENVDIRVAYWFVSTRGGFKMRPSVAVPLDEVLEPFSRAVGTITGGISSGLFPANPGMNDSNPRDNCTYCDFDKLCLTRRAVYWENKQNDPRLADYVSMAAGTDGEDSE